MNSQFSSVGQIGPRIDGPVIHAHLVMEVGCGGPPRRSDESEDVSSFDFLADFDKRPRKMAIPRRQAIAVIHNDQVAVGCLSFGVENDAVRRRMNLSIKQRRNINAEVKFSITAEGVRTIPIVTRDRAFDRPNVWGISKS